MTLLIKSRLICVLFTGVTLLFLPSTQAQAQNKPAMVCVENAEEALVLALQYQQAIGQEIAWFKSLEGKRLERARWKAEEFLGNLAAYLGAVPESALLLYAADALHVCAFLWEERSGLQPIYVRQEIRLNQLNDRAAAWRVAIASQFAPSDRKGRARLSELKEQPEAVSELPSTAAAIDGSALTQELSETLFPMAFKDVLQRTKFLTIVPIGAVSTLPIGLLHPTGGTERVVDLFSVNYLLFAGEVRNGPASWTGNLKKPLVFGDPSNNLPAAAFEAGVAAYAFGGEPLFRADATADAYMQRSADADLIYFASHALSDAGNPLDGGFIVLADNKLDGYYIQRHDLRAKLVVMSACQTGLGQVVEAGVIGLARSFLDAGASNTVMSSWNVNDGATALLMSKFIRLLKVHPPAEALRRAQLEFEKEGLFKEPAYWAAFSVYGNLGVMAPAN